MQTFQKDLNDSLKWGWGGGGWNVTHGRTYTHCYTGSRNSCIQNSVRRISTLFQGIPQWNWNNWKAGVERMLRPLWVAEAAPRCGWGGGGGESMGQPQQQQQQNDDKNQHNQHTQQQPSKNKVTWCFTPTQPVRLYQGDKQTKHRQKPT